MLRVNAAIETAFKTSKTVVKLCPQVNHSFKPFTKFFVVYLIYHKVY